MQGETCGGPKASHRTDDEHVTSESPEKDGRPSREGGGRRVAVGTGPVAACVLLVLWHDECRQSWSALALLRVPGTNAANRVKVLFISVDT